jgi:hypothetical protein
MTNRLTIDELDTVNEVLSDRIDSALCNTPEISRLATIRQKLHELLQNTRKLRDEEQAAKKAAFPDAVDISSEDIDEAQAMSDQGELHMMRAVGVRLPEAPYRRLCCLQIGLVSALQRACGIHRSNLANNMASNLMLSALKAAYMEGGGPTLQRPDDGS